MTKIEDMTEDLRKWLQLPGFSKKEHIINFCIRYTWLEYKKLIERRKGINNDGVLH